MSIVAAVRCLLPALRERGLEVVSAAKHSPLGKTLYSASLLTRLANPFQGFHVTQAAKVMDQVEKGRFSNQNRNIYFNPTLAEGTDRSPLLYGGERLEGLMRRPGCWTNDEPVVVLRIGSSRIPYWHPRFDFPFFARGEEQSVFILDAWKLNPKWVAQMRACDNPKQCSY